MDNVNEIRDRLASKLHALGGQIPYVNPTGTIAEPNRVVQNGNPARGAKLFKAKCMMCHMYMEGRSSQTVMGAKGSHAISKAGASTGSNLDRTSAGGQSSNRGSNIWGVLNKNACMDPEYDQQMGYSTALRQSGIVWTPAHLDAYMQAPREHVPGTGKIKTVSSEKERSDIIAFLAQEVMPQRPSLRNNIGHNLRGPVIGDNKAGRGSGSVNG